MTKTYIDWVAWLPKLDLPAPACEAACTPMFVIAKTTDTVAVVPFTPGYIPDELQHIDLGWIVKRSQYEFWIYTNQDRREDYDFVLIPGHPNGTVGRTRTCAIQYGPFRSIRTAVKQLKRLCL